MKETNNQTSVNTLCPNCKEMIKGVLYEKNGKLRISSYCKKHGKNDVIYFQNERLYKKLKKITIFNPIPINKDLDNSIILYNNPKNLVTSIHINFTEKCNLNCPICFASANNSNHSQHNELPVKDIINHIDNVITDKFRPMIVIIGGEPTIRKDLNQLIQLLNDRNLNVRLSTNGVKLINLDYLKSLKKSGLNWLLLQFDGFKKSTSEKFRKINLIERKLQVIKNAQSIRLKIHLISMIQKNINDDEILKMINFAFKEPEIYAINFYPNSSTGRNEVDLKTTALDVINFIEILTNKSIRWEDFIWMKRIMRLLYKIFKKPIFKPKICTYSIFLYKFHDIVYPITNLFKIKTILRHPIFTFKKLIKSIKLKDWADNPSKDFIYMNIEDFYNDDSFILEDAMNCHNGFLTKDGLVPFCIFNTVYREKRCY